MFKYQIVGSFLGTAIGDALGMAVENKTPDFIKDNYGQITNYVKSNRSTQENNKDYIEGEWTDDTQLMLATAEAMIEAKGFDMEAIAEYHKKAYEQSTSGWGKSTKSAVKNMISGTAWYDATKIDYFGNGGGNGVVMKLMPLAAFCIKQDKDFKTASEMLWSFTLMTHTTVIAQQASYAHYLALRDVFLSGQNKFDSATFINNIYKDLIKYTNFAFYAVNKEEDLIGQYDKIKDLPLLLGESRDTEQFRKTIGKGGCYVYESLPLVHAMFLTAPEEFECVINTVNYGGDTDSNASMVGGLHGALIGDKKIPKDLVKKLKDKDRIIDVANKFWELINDK